MPVAEGSAMLDGQLVQGKMVYSHVQRPRQFLGPIFRCLVLPRVNEVETDAIIAGPGDIEGRNSLCRCMQPSKPLQVCVIQRLNTHRQPVHPCRPERAELSSFYRPGICLQRHLPIICHNPCCANPVQNCEDRFRIH